MVVPFPIYPSQLVVVESGLSLMPVMTVGLQLPIISVPAGFVQSTPILPSKADTFFGS